MEYAQLNEAMNAAFQVTTNGNVAWATTHFCPASKLTADEAARFRVVPLTVTTPPAINNMTQIVIRDGCELVAGGWQYKWRVDNMTAVEIETVRKASIPRTITMRQARLALDAAGLLDTVNAAIEALTGKPGKAARIEWQFSSEVKRDQPIMLGLTPAQLDAVFIAGAKL